MIGPRGMNVKKVQAMKGVLRVDIRSEGTVQIVAQTEKQAEEAKMLLQIVEEKVPIDQQDVGFLIGKAGKQVRWPLSILCVGSCEVTHSCSDEWGSSFSCINFTITVTITMSITLIIAIVIVIVIITIIIAVIMITM